MGVQAAQALITAFLSHFSGVHEFIVKCVENARRDGHVKTLLGRQRPMMIDATGGMGVAAGAGGGGGGAGSREGADRRAINTTIQVGDFEDRQNHGVGSNQ